MYSFKQLAVFFLFIEGIIYIFLRNTDVLLPVLLSVLTIYLLLFYFSMNLQLNVYLKAKNKAKKGYAVLGFDDGPDPEMTLKILDILETYNAKAIFFLIGKNAINHPDIVKEIVKRGHLIGGHTLNHPANFGTLGFCQAEKEILHGIKVVEAIINQKITLFRPPLGISNPIIAAITKNNNLQVVGWNIRSYDTINKNAQKMLTRITRQIDDRSSILFHDRVQNTVEILPYILQDMQNKKLIIFPEID